MSHKRFTSREVLIPKSKDRALRPGLLYRLFWFQLLGKSAVQYSGHRNRLRTYGAPAIHIFPPRLLRQWRGIFRKRS